MNIQKGNAGPEVKQGGEYMPVMMFLHDAPKPMVASRQDAVRQGIQKVICVDYAQNPIEYTTMAPLLEELEAEMPELLKDESSWSDVVIDAMPQMNRLYRFWRPGLRIYLHKIEPCKPEELSVLHFHQWPSIVKIHKGGYKQALAFGDTFGETPPICATVDVTPGSVYEMVHPNLWHAPIPSESPSWSTMITATGTWRTPMKNTGLTREMKFPHLTMPVRKELFREFREFYPEQNRQS